MARNLQLQVVLDAIDRATGPLKNIARGSAGAGEAIRQTRDRIRELQDQQKGISAFQDMTRQAKETRGALTDKRKELEQLTAEIKATDNPGRRLINQQQRTQKEVERLSSRYREQTQRSAELRGQLPPSIQNIREMSAQQTVLAREISAANERMARQQEALRKLGDADVSGKFRNMSSEVGRLGRRVMVTGGAAAGGIFALANSVAKAGDDIVNTAAKANIGIEQLQELRYAGERHGMDASAMDATLVTMTRRIGHAARGAGPAVKSLDALGLSAEALGRMAPEKALGVIGDALNRIDDDALRISHASQIFNVSGGAAMLQVLKDGSEGLREMAAQSRLTGYVLSEQMVLDGAEFREQMSMAQLSITGLKNVLGAELMPAITEVMQKFSGWMIENRHQVQAFAKTAGARLKEMVPVILDLGRGFVRVATWIARTVRTVANLVGGFENLAMIVAVLFASKAIWSVIAFGIAIGKAVLAMLSLAKTLGIAAGATKLLSIALMGTPVGWILAAIAAIAAAAYLIYRNWDSIGGFFKNRWGEVREAFSLGIFGVLKLLYNWSPFGLMYRGMIGWLERMGIEIPEQFKTLGSAIIDGFWGGIFSKLGALKDGVVGVARSVRDWFKSDLEIKSPSRVFATFGVNTMEGFQQGIERGEAKPLREIGNFARRVRRAGAGLALGAISTAATALPGAGALALPSLDSLRLDTRGPIAATATGAAQISLGGIHVYPSPGMDEQALARYVADEVQRALAEAQHQAAVRERSAFRDID